MMTKYRLITISGTSGTGKSLLTKALAAKIGWPIFSISSRQRENVKKFGLKVIDVDQLPDDVHRQADASMEEMIKSGQNIILESRLAGWQSGDYPDILRILCQASPKIKFLRYANRERISLDQAEKELEERDERNLKKFTKLYQAADYLNPNFYQLIIPTDRLTPDEEVLKVLDLLNNNSKNLQ